VLLVKELEGGCGGTCVTASVMTDVGLGVGTVVGTVVVGVGRSVPVIVGTGVIETVAGGGVEAEVALLVAIAVTTIPVAGIVFTPDRGVPDED
jgi:hypothetical protein